MRSTGIGLSGNGSGCCGTYACDPTLFPPAAGANIQLQAPGDLQALSTADQIVKAFTVEDFSMLLSRRAMLPLIIFTIFFGFCLQTLGEGTRCRTRDRSICRCNAPDGQIPYVLCTDRTWRLLCNSCRRLRTKPFSAYLRSMIVYHIATFGYFFVAFTIYS